MVKGDGDKQLAIAAVVFGHVPIALVLIPFVDLPAPASWPYIVSGGLLHVGYQVFLARAYRSNGDHRIGVVFRCCAYITTVACNRHHCGRHHEYLYGAW